VVANAIHQTRQGAHGHTLSDGAAADQLANDTSDSSCESSDDCDELEERIGAPPKCGASYLPYDHRCTTTHTSSSNTSGSSSGSSSTHGNSAAAATGAAAVAASSSEHVWNRWSRGDATVCCVRTKGKHLTSHIHVQLKCMHMACTSWPVLHTTYPSTTL
jgi:hypothetical protein